MPQELGYHLQHANLIFTPGQPIFSQATYQGPNGICYGFTYLRKEITIVPQPEENAEREIIMRETDRFHRITEDMSALSKESKLRQIAVNYDCHEEIGGKEKAFRTMKVGITFEPTWIKGHRAKKDQQDVLFTAETTVINGQIAQQKLCINEPEKFGGVVAVSTQIPTHMKNGVEVVLHKEGNNGNIHIIYESRTDKEPSAMYTTFAEGPTHLRRIASEHQGEHLKLYGKLITLRDDCDAKEMLGASMKIADHVKRDFHVAKEQPPAFVEAAPTK